MRITERAGYALTGTTSDESRKAIANELRGVLDGIVQIARTSVDGLYLFSGTSVQTDPVERNPDGSFSYAGDSETMEIEITEGEQVQVNVSGDEVFLNSGGDLLNSVTELIDAIDSSQLDDAQLALGKVVEAGKQIDRARFEISHGLQKTEAARQRLNDRMVELTSEVSNLEDADMAEAISQMVNSETALNASLGAGARMRQGNLFDFMG